MLGRMPRQMSRLRILRPLALLFSRRAPLRRRLSRILNCRLLGDVASGANTNATLTYAIPPFRVFGCQASIVNRARVTTASIDGNPANDLAIFANRFDRASRSGVAEICTNEIDDDCDGFRNCFDSECTNHPDCRPPIQEEPDRNPPVPCPFQADSPCLGPGGPSSPRRNQAMRRRHLGRAAVRVKIRTSTVI